MKKLKIILIIILLNFQNIFCMKKYIFKNINPDELVEAAKSGDYKNIKAILKKENIDTHYILKSIEEAYKNQKFYCLKTLLINANKDYITSQSFKNLIIKIIDDNNINLFKFIFKNKLIKYNSKFFGDLEIQELKFHSSDLFLYLLSKNNYELFEYIILNDKEFDINAIPPYHGYPPLIIACLIGNKKIVNLLINNLKIDIENSLNIYKKEIDKTCEDCWYDTIYIREDIINILQRKIYDSNFIKNTIQNSMKFPKTFNPQIFIDENCNNILHLALEYQNYKLYNKISKKFPDLLLKFNYEGQTPFDLLTEQYIKLIKLQNYKVLKELLLDVKFSNIKDSNGDTLLHHAINSGNLDIIKLILFFAPQLVLIKNKAKNTPMHLASNKPDILKFIIKGAYKT